MDKNDAVKWIRWCIEQVQAGEVGLEDWDLDGDEHAIILKKLDKNVVKALSEKLAKIEGDQAELAAYDFADGDTKMTLVFKDK